MGGGGGTFMALSMERERQRVAGYEKNKFCCSLHYSWAVAFNVNANFNPVIGRITSMFC